MFKLRDPKSLRETVTGDKTRIYFYEPENKEYKKVWVSTNEVEVELSSVLCRLCILTVME